MRYKVTSLILLLLFISIQTVSADYIFNSSTDWANTSYDNFAYDRNTGYLILPDNITDGLVLYHKMSGSSGITSYDMNLTSDNNGTLTNMNTGLNNCTGNCSGWNSSGKYGNAIAFDGVDDYVNCGNDSSLNLVDGTSGLFTIGMWVRTPNPTSQRHGLIEKDLSATSGFMAEIGTHDANDGRITFWNAYDFGARSTTVLSPDTWYYITLLYDGTTRRIYINGILDGSDTDVFGTSGNDNLTIGHCTWDAEITKLTGTIDSVRIYTRVLTNDEINQTMNNTMVISNNVTHWHDAGSGNQGSQFKFVFNNDSDSFIEGWVSADNSTWYQVTDNMTNNTLSSITAAYKNQTQYTKAILKGNSTTTPYLIESVITTESSTVGTTPNITSYAPPTPNSTYENVASTYNATINQSNSNNEWLINGSRYEWDNATDSPAYTNSTWTNGTYNLTLISHNNSDHSLTDNQTWIVTVLLNSVDINITYWNPDSGGLVATINVTNITSGLQAIYFELNNTNSGWLYTVTYSNGTYVDSATSTYENESLNFSIPLIEDSYNITESIATSNITIPADSWGMINNWTVVTNFSNIATNESNDVAYSYYNVTTGEWDSHYPPYSWNSDNVIPLEASVMVFVNAETTVTATIVTPANTNLYTGWNMLYIQGTDNETIASIITDIGANCTDVWWFNSTAGAYSNTSSDSVQPCQGILPYITQNFTWTRSDL